MSTLETASCWSTPARPSAELLSALKGATLGEGQLALLRRERVDKPVILVGTGTCGLGAGAARTLEMAKQYLADHHWDAEVGEVGCLGLCSEEPLLDVHLPGRLRISLGRVTAERVAEVLDAVRAGTAPAELALGQFRGDGTPWTDVTFMDQHPFFAPQMRWVLANAGIINPSNIDEYIARGGYSALLDCLRSKRPDEICDWVALSGLRGRGGGGFPTGVKWKLARESPGERYLVCNADEGDPGAFMDRAVAESDPFRLLEGMVIAAFAIGAHRAYIYIRAEYPLAVERLRAAIPKATQYGLLGHDILGSGFDLDITIKLGAGAFVCGEETALLHSIEGKRGMPRSRPPFPAQSGLHGHPTVINNVETLACLPGVMSMGPEAFASVGTAKSKGTKVFALSGMVRRTGLVEIPMGTSIRRIVFDIGGGTPSGKRCKAVQMGGPSGGCIPESEMDVPVDYDALKTLGAIMGSGGMVVLDESTCMVDLAKFFMQFIQNESCGKCTPCREGTRRLLGILEALIRPRHKEAGLDALDRFQGVLRLQQLAEVIRACSLCGLGQTAPNPVLSTLRWFRAEYEAHLFDRHCPAGACKDLVGPPCQNTCPVGTEVWRYVAHVSRGELKEAYQVIREANPFPSVCARVCGHPCEVACRCGTTGGDPIAVRALKRFVVDQVEPCALEVTPAAPDGKRVAVVGAGPSGLTAAHILSSRGFLVTVFERESEPGGMLCTGIPGYRLPREVIRKEIASLANVNWEIRCNVALGRDFTIDSLLSSGYSAVYLATGAYRSQRLGVPGEDVAGVLLGMHFLKAHNLRGEHLARGRVGVVGGGNAALDAARVALRQPAVEKVTILYRRDRADMPAFPEEIEAALEEGVELVTLVAPVEMLENDHHLSGVRLVRNRLATPDASSRRRPVPIAGSEFELALDTLIVAISEDSEVIVGAPQGPQGRLQASTESCATARPGVFGGGDLVRGPSGVVHAIADGKRAALMIERYLTGRQMRMIGNAQLPAVFIEPPESTDDAVVPRACVETVPAIVRRSSFAEVDLGLTAESAACEARRCLRCDLDFTRPVGK